MSQIINDTYQIIEKIGQGGMSVVYKAKHIRLSTIWAVKKVSKNLSYKINYRSEAEILKRLEHPMLPKVVDIFEDNDFLYIVEDYIEGEDLSKVLIKHKSIDEKTALLWFEKIVDCLIYLHNQTPNPIIYRDLKPSNIILQPNGKIKLIDFGIAREYKEKAISDTSYIGTKGYAAPEQFGKAQTDARSDIYSLGVTMYHIVTGKSPYAPPYSFVPVRQLNPQLSIGIEKIINKCIQIEPQNRYQTAIELLNDITQIHKFDENYKRYKKNILYRKYSLVFLIIISIVMILSGAYCNFYAKNMEFNYYISTAVNSAEENSDDALKYIEQAEKLKKNSANVDIAKSYMYYYMEDYEQSITYINTALEKDGKLENDIDVLSLLASSYYGLEEYELALSYYEKAVSLEESPSSALMRDYSVTLALCDKTDEAKKVLEDIKLLGEEQDVISYISGNISYAEGNFLEAEALFKEAIELSEDSIIKQKSIMSLAYLYRDAAETDNIEINDPRSKSISFINDMMKEEEMINNPTLWELLSEAYFYRAMINNDSYDDYMNSAYASEQILKLNIQKKYIYTNIYNAYQRAGENNKALVILDEMENVYPNAYEANAYRAIMFIMMENNRPMEQRNYNAAYSEYLVATEKIAESDDNSLMVQLEDYIQQLINGGWI